MKQTAPPSGEATALDAGLRAFCGIAAYYRIGADPLQLARELALVDRQADEFDLIRAAKLIGMRARLVSGADAERMGRLPTPAIVRLKNGALVVFGGRSPSGLCRLVDPISHAATEIPLDDLTRETGGQALLVARRIGGAGANPKTFGMRWFLPTIWRYRRPLGHVLAASLFVQIFALTAPLIFQVIVDKVLTHKGYETLFVMIAGLVVIGLFDVLLQYLRAYALSHTTNRIDVELGQRLFAHLLRLADKLFRNAFGRPDCRPGARTRNDPQLSNRPGAVFGDRSPVHLRLHRRDVRLFVEPDADRARGPSRLHPDRLRRAASAARSREREIQPRRREPAVPGRDRRRRRHRQVGRRRADDAGAVGGEARGLCEDELRRDDARDRRPARHSICQQAHHGCAAAVRGQGGDRRRTDCRARSWLST